MTGLHAGVLDALGRRIVDGQLAAGTVLTLARMESEFGVSRTVARETMRLLESMGLISSRRRVGITVNAPAHWNVLDHRLIRWRLQGHAREEQLRSLTELRLAIEPLSAALAAERADDADRHRLVELAARLKDLGAKGLGRTDDYLQADIAFHTLLLSASGNEMIAALADVIGEVLVGRTKLGMMPERPVPASQRGHLALAQAVASGDAEAAEREAVALLSEVRSGLSDAGIGRSGD